MPDKAVSLISVAEAEEVAKPAPMSFLTHTRIPLMVVVGIIAVVTATLLIMTLLSLRGSRTGLSTILPFLDKDQTSTLLVK